MDFLEKILKNNNIHLAIMGIFKSYDKWCEKSEVFKNNTTFIGVQKDFVGVMMLFDLFINPPRRGNGSLALAATTMGLPIVTFPDNDVSSLIEKEVPDLVVNSYESMIKKINQFIADSKFQKRISAEMREIAYNYSYDNKNIKGIQEVILEAANRKNFW